MLLLFFYTRFLSVAGEGLWKNISTLSVVFLFQSNLKSNKFVCSDSFNIFQLCLCHSPCLCICLCHCLFVVQQFSSLAVTLIKCLKSHKSSSLVHPERMKLWSSLGFLKDRRKAFFLNSPEWPFICLACEDVGSEVHQVPIEPRGVI